MPSPFLPASATRRWHEKPKNQRRVLVNGEETVLYTVGAVAEALDRKSVTIRLWIRNGLIPDATWKLPSGEHELRLWSREQVETLVNLLEKALDGRYRSADMSKTSFRFLVRAHWDAMGW